MQTEWLEYVTDAKEAKEVDRVSMQEIGMPSLVLMERAALSLAEEIRTHHDARKEKILVVCGSGNNGADGVAAARMLSEWNYSVNIWFVGNLEHVTEEMDRQLHIVKNCGITISTYVEPSEYTIIIDALFGIGLNREVQGKYRDVIAKINDSDAMVYAVDIASGVNATDGKVLGTAVQADVTVTFGTAKRGHLLFPGTAYAGKVLVKDIGFPKKAWQQVSPKAFTLRKEAIGCLLPTRKSRTNKGSYGHVLILAGCETMSGACYLSAKAAYRIGCGLVRIVTAEANVPILKTKLPEAIVESWESLEENDLNWFAGVKEWANVIVFGPGIGQSEHAKRMLDDVLTVKDIPVVLDADGLNLLAQRDDYFQTDEEMESTAFRQVKLGSNFVLTPHMKEMSRLCRLTVPEIQAMLCAVACHSSTEATVVLKDARTIVASRTRTEDAKKIYINQTGNNALATGGSGDVLSGIIGGLLAQGMTPAKAATLGVLIHGATAESFLSHGNRYSMMAGDIIEELLNVCK